jgi:hypothetical protein
MFTIIAKQVTMLHMDMGEILCRMFDQVVRNLE